MVINWIPTDILFSPEMGKYRGKSDYEALLAISSFTHSFAIDLSGTLKYEFPVNLIQDYSSYDQAVPVSSCMDARAKEIWEHHDTVAVLCAGDIDSVAPLAALCKHAPDISKVIVRYTQAGLTRYPRLFNEILPNLGVTLECRDGMPLVGQDRVFYIDGRTGDDWQGAYQASILGRLRKDIDIEDLDEVIKYICTDYDHRPKFHSKAREGLKKFIKNCPIPITNGWGLIVALFRFCVTQHDCFIGHVTEDDPEHSFKYRVPFYDDPMFTNATAYVMQNSPPDVDDDSRQLKDYIFDYFGDSDYRANERPVAAYYVYRLGKINSHFLGEDARPYPYYKLNLGK